MVAGETVTIGTEGGGDDFLGPLGQWILGGMETKEIIKTLGIVGNEKQEGKTQPPSPTKISIHTIDLPTHAPKKMLLDLKKVLETFPGKERVQLKIGEQTIALPLTINMSTVLEKKIDEVMSYHETAEVS